MAQWLKKFNITKTGHSKKKTRGRELFLVMACPAKDFSQPLSNDIQIRGTLFLEFLEFFNVNALTS